MPNEQITTDFAEGFRIGFEVARQEMERVVREALAEGKSVRKAISGVEVPAPMRELTGLEYRGG